MSRREWGTTTRLIDAAVDILDEQSPMTVRQLFYRLVSQGLIENSRSGSQKVSRLMTKARNDGRCDFDKIVDRSRPKYAPNVWEDPSGYADTIMCAYRKDYWATQSNYCEIWAEKDAIIGSIEDLTDQLGITVRVGRGFLSTTRSYEIAQHFSRLEKPITVFYLGDHDPSGQNIETNAWDRVLNYMNGWRGESVSIRRLAILPEDIKGFDLPPLRAKDSDTRTPKYRAKYGDECVELDALPPDELRHRIRKAVESLLDQALWDRAVAIEKVELASIQDTVSRWPRAEEKS